MCLSLQVLCSAEKEMAGNVQLKRKAMQAVRSKSLHSLTSPERCAMPTLWIFCRLQKYKHSGKLGRELGASQEPNRTLLEVQQYKTQKQTYEQGNMRCVLRLRT